MPAKRHLITRGDDYRRTVRTGNRVGGANCITHAVLREPGEPARFGFIVSKAVGNAVVRNRLRRRMKTIADRQIAEGLSAIDIVFRALPSSADATFSELEQQLNRAIARAREDALGKARRIQTR